MSRVSGWVSTPVTELAIVIWSPSRIHAAPSPQTMRVWNGDQLRRSRRAGTVVRIGACTVAELLIGDPLSVNALRSKSSRIKPRIRGSVITPFG